MVAASALSLSGLTRLWNQGYTGYFVPIELDDARMRRHLACGPVDLERSLVVVDGEEPVAFSLLAAHGERGWIGGFGVAPSHRGRGLAYQLFAEHAARFAGWGLRRVRLELFEQNWVRKVYERAGFRVTRRLSLLEGSAPAAGAPLPSASPEVLWPHHARLHASAPPAWNRQPEWLACAAPAARVLLHGLAEQPDGALLYDQADGVARVLDVAAEDERVAARLLQALGGVAPGQALRLVNEPEDSPVARAWTAAGWVEQSAQLEMHWSAEETEG